MADGVTRDDLRAAVASGVIDEAQAVKLQTLSDQRMGYRANMIGDDEPFELFKGFAEIFVTVGLVLFVSGFLGMTAVIGGGAVVPLIMLGLSVILAFYFTKKRRMSLPSIALCITFAASLLVIFEAFTPANDAQLAAHQVACGTIGMVGLGLYYRVFRLPFAMFVFACFGLFALAGIVQLIEPSNLSVKTDILRRAAIDPFGLWRFIDLRNSPYMAVGTLLFGILAFIGALYFDTKDPHRISRYASTAFWLHIVAAPALVNTLVMSNYTMGGIGTIIAIVLLAIFTLLAIIIDRRSFLTAGLVYMGLLISQAIGSSGTEWASVLTMLVLGVFVTTLGAFWTQARATVMGALPDFPGKGNLPPYAAGLTVSE